MSNSTDLDSSLTSDNSTDSGGPTADYDPNAYRPEGRHRVELALLCLFNSLSLILIVSRLAIKYRRLKRFRQDDWWLMAATVLLIFPLWVSQIMTNHYGGGYPVETVSDEDLDSYFKWSAGYIGYNLIVTLIKISLTICFLEIMPRTFKYLRWYVYGLCTFTGLFGLTLSILLLIPCRPLASNFVYEIQYTSCIGPNDSIRYTWIAGSIFIDIILCYVPFYIIKSTQLRRMEKNLLLFVFLSILLGTIACAMEIYAIRASRESESGTDITYQSTPWIIANDFEIMMYCLGAFIPTLSPYLIQRYGGGASSAASKAKSGASSGSATLTTGPSYNRKTYDEKDTTLFSQDSAADVEGPIIVRDPIR